jgi:hypothetical protein
MGTKPSGERKPPKTKTSTFLLELPLAVEAGQAARLRAHLETGRQFYNAVLSAGQRRLRQMRADPAWQAARAIPRTHTFDETVPIVPWMWPDGQKAALAAASPVRVRYRAGSARPVFGVSGRLSRSNRTYPLVCPVCRPLGRCRGAPEGSTRASHPTRERGAGAAPKHGYPPCRSASARKSERSDTRAAFPLQEGEGGSVEAPPRTPRA